jgi:YbbR domain-containing protein
MQDNKKRKPSDSGRTITIILSIIIALLLWSYVIIQVNPTKEETISRVPVQLLNTQSLAARQLAISGDGEYTVDVVVEGRRADIMKVSGEDIIAEVDLFGWSKGENYIPVNVKLPPALKLVEVRSAKIQVTIEDLVALSKPVDVVYRGEFPANTEEGDVELRPAEIEVTGAKSAVESVDEVRVYIDVEDLSTERRTIQSEAVPLNKAEMIVENVKLSSSYVNVSARLLQVKEVPLVVETVGSLDEGYGAEIDVPQFVLIKGTKAALQDVTSVSAEPLDITGMTKNGIMPITLLLPEGVELSKRNTTIHAGITIEETATGQFRFTADDILLEGLTKGKTVNTDVAEVTVSITGRKQTVEQLQQNQLELYIEIEDLETGSHTVPIMVSSKVPLHSIIVDPSEIHITIIDIEQENLNE